MGQGQRPEALRHLVDFTTRMSQDLGLNPNDLITQPLPSEGPGIPKHVEEYTKLLARCFLKQGEWQIALNSNWRSETSEIILGAYLLATHFDNKWYKAWHNWALANFEVISLYTSQNTSANNKIEILQDERNGSTEDGHSELKRAEQQKQQQSSSSSSNNKLILYQSKLFKDMSYHLSKDSFILLLYPIQTLFRIC